METRFSHSFIDRCNAEHDRHVASLLCRDPRVLKAARASLRRWIARDGMRIRATFREWDQILTRLTPAEIAAFLRSDTPMARRLRQSSPFAGVPIKAGRRLRRSHEKART